MGSKILPYKPRRYLKQPWLRYCGIYQITTILEAKMGIEKAPNSVFSGITRITGLCVPKQIFRKCNELGLSADIIPRGSVTVEQLKTFLDENRPVVLLTGHGFSPKRKGFNILQAAIKQHYISVRGYDQDRGGFFVYDSSVSESKATRGLPIGNFFLPERVMKKALRWGGLGVIRKTAIVVG